MTRQQKISKPSAHIIVWFWISSYRGCRKWPPIKVFPYIYETPYRKSLKFFQSKGVYLQLFLTFVESYDLIRRRSYFPSTFSLFYISKCRLESPHQILYILLEYNLTTYCFCYRIFKRKYSSFFNKCYCLLKKKANQKLFLIIAQIEFTTPGTRSKQEKPFASDPHEHTVILLVWVSVKFGTCTVVSVNGTLEDKMRRFKGECAHFRFNKCPIYTQDGASSKYSTNSHETDNSAVWQANVYIISYTVL